MAATIALTGDYPSIPQDIVNGGKQIILTVTGDTWVASGATFNATRAAIIAGIDSAQAEAHGWDIEVKGKELVAAVVRTSATVVTITFSAAAAYAITAPETITVTVPAAALVGAAPIIASPTFVIRYVTNASSNIGKPSQYSSGVYGSIASGLTF
jgi:p-aminobenzoyl-glutamate transporter AbgT